ncbi:hypothetical protein GGR53DRAFT_505612 [Hypoxylon sp. FL1150]|nr:hypothetical protein GGR53DRAFT_505612 [Hypoxylon sp. FL1150]
MLPRVFRPARLLQATRSSQVSGCSYRHHHHHDAPFTSVAARGAVLFDQTKKSNDPSEDQKEGHHKEATSTPSDGDRGHPAKQPDPQQSPSKSTGIRDDGPGGSESGKGRDEGVHKEKDVAEKDGQMDNYPYAIDSKVQGPEGPKK